MQKFQSQEVSSLCKRSDATNATLIDTLALQQYIDKSNTKERLEYILKYTLHTCQSNLCQRENVRNNVGKYNVHVSIRDMR